MRHYSVPAPSSSTGPKDTHNSTLGQRTQGDLIQLLARIDKYTAQLITSEKARITIQCQALPTAQSADSVAAFAKKTPEGGSPPTTKSCNREGPPIPGARVPHSKTSRLAPYKPKNKTGSHQAPKLPTTAQAPTPVDTIASLIHQTPPIAPNIDPKAAANTRTPIGKSPASRSQPNNQTGPNFAGTRNNHSPSPGPKAAATGGTQK